jgi:hypothetical protein
MKTHINLLLFTASIITTTIAASEIPQTQGYFSRLYSNITQWVNRTPFIPGWQITAEQKKQARKELRKLLLEKYQLETELEENTDLTDQQIKNKQNEIAKIEQNIHKQKVILGDRWSTRRKIVTGTAVAGLSALGLSPLKTTPEHHLKHIRVNLNKPVSTTAHYQWYTIDSNSYLVQQKGETNPSYITLQPNTDTYILFETSTDHPKRIETVKLRATFNKPSVKIKSTKK